jgi:hypothetical protein
MLQSRCWARRIEVFEWFLQAVTDVGPSRGLTVNPPGPCLSRKAAAALPVRARPP